MNIIIYINQICVGNGVNRSVILINGSPPTRNYFLIKNGKIIGANLSINTTCAIHTILRATMYS